MDPILTTLLEAVRTGGPVVSVIMTVLWWLERTERKALQEKRDELLTRTLSAIAVVGSVLPGRSNGPT